MRDPRNIELWIVIDRVFSGSTNKVIFGSESFVGLKIFGADAYCRF